MMRISRRGRASIPARAGSERERLESERVGEVEGLRKDPAGNRRNVSRAQFCCLAAMLLTLLGQDSRAETRDLAACRVEPAKIEAAHRKFSLLNHALVPAVAFSDIGCAIIARKNFCAMEMVAFDGNSIVYDYRTGEELPAEKAYFVVSAAVSTPFGFGVVALGDKEAAERLLAELGGGRLLLFDELKNTTFR